MSPKVILKYLKTFLIVKTIASLENRLVEEAPEEMLLNSEAQLLPTVMQSTTSRILSVMQWNDAGMYCTKDGG